MGEIRYLLDTHTFLWAVRESQKLSAAAKNVIANKNSKCYISAVSAYEILNKYRIGKLLNYEYLIKNYFNIIHKLNIINLSINTYHAHHAGKFEWNHRDPFDRLLAAQAYIENMTLITNDSTFESLPWLSVLW